MLQEVRLLKKYKKNLLISSDIKEQRLKIENNEEQIKDIKEQIVIYSQQVSLHDYASIIKANNQLQWLDVLNSKLSKYQQESKVLNEIYQNLAKQHQILQLQIKQAKKSIENEKKTLSRHQQKLLDEDWQKWNVEQVLWSRHG
jgi:hypothetical protein